MKFVKRRDWILWAMAAIYFVSLSWLILFKGQFSLPDFGQYRSINLIPFGASVIVNGRLQFSELLMNVVLFIPLGLYTGMLRPKWSVWAWCLMGVEVSLSFEILQYILGVGATDITDVITNSIGGVLGVLLLLLLKKILKEKTMQILTILAVAATVVILGFMFLILAAN